LVGIVGNTKTPFNVDFGVGDVVIPDTALREIPVQLENFSKPQIMTYSIESTIAEKFDAILQRFELNSRMKDFYDIYYLSEMFSFDGTTLLAAVKSTLTARSTTYSADSMKRVAELNNDANMQRMWKRFLKTIAATEPNFSETVDLILKLLGEIMDCIIEGRKELNKQWNNEKQIWA
jgi:predicted nucleotidyltransferase component of viral defense system